MAEFRVVLDGLELNEEQHALVAQAVLAAGLKAVNDLSGRKARRFLAVSADPWQGPDWMINGGWVIRDRLAGKALGVLREQGILRGEMGQ